MQIAASYLEFITDCIAHEESNILLQGGRRSGKTYATFQTLESIGNMVGNLNILVVCGQFPQLQATMQDFTDCLNIPVKANIINGYSARSGKGTMWQFRNIDSKEKAQGTKCDILFVNEAVNVLEEVVDTLSFGVRWFKIYNYNPTKKCYLQRLMNDDGSNLMITTWKDNPYLTEEQQHDFERMKERALRPAASRYEIMLYEVYYKGNFSELAGAVFGSVGKITEEYYKQIPATEVYGVDFGFAMDGDPTTMIGCKIYKSKIHLHQYIYERGLTNDEELAHRMVACGIDRYSLVFGDYGGAGKGRMNTLVTADNGRWTGEIAGGIPLQDAVKTAILDGLSQMLSMDGILITDTSTDMIDEFEAYELDSNGKPKGDDHAIDAARYAVVYAKNFL